MWYPPGGSLFYECFLWCPQLITYKLAAHDFSCRDAERHPELLAGQDISVILALCVLPSFCCWLFAIFLKIITPLPLKDWAEEYEKVWYWDHFILLFRRNRSWGGQFRSEGYWWRSSTWAGPSHSVGVSKQMTCPQQGASRVCLSTLIGAFGQTGYIRICLVRAATQTPAKTWCPCGFIPVVSKSFFY